MKNKRSKISEKLISELANIVRVRWRHMKYTRHKIKMQNCVQHTLDFSPVGTTFWLNHQRVSPESCRDDSLRRGIVIVSIKFSNASSERLVTLTNDHGTPFP